MIQTKNNQAIYPLDLTSVMQLLVAPTGDFSPLATTITKTNSDGVEIELNIGQCDPDSIRINHSNNKLHISANAHVQFLNTPGQSMLNLTRSCTQTIDIPAGVATGQIHSQLSDDTLTLHIPFDTH